MRREEGMVYQTGKRLFIRQCSFPLLSSRFTTKKITHKKKVLLTCSNQGCVIERGDEHAAKGYFGLAIISGEEDVDQVSGGWGCEWV
jgi:hypothetical protein